MRNQLTCGFYVLIVLSVFSTTSAKIIYVDRSAVGSNNGTSWIDAYTALQDALTACAFNDEIRAAQGTYLPDQGAGKTPGDKTAFFALKNGIKVYGGFPIGGDTWENRNPSIYVTILSGDLSNNDIVITDPASLLNAASRADNSYHVVKATLCGPITILDGFTITAGNAKSTGVDADGAGMYNYTNSSPTISNCIFTKNAATNYGGAIISEEYRSKPTLQNCTFSLNWANYGGAITNRTNTMPKYNNCVFNSNKAYYRGGGLYCNLSTITLSDSTLNQNNAGEYGGAINIENEGILVMGNCVCAENTCSSYDGGAINLLGVGNIHSISQCQFFKNVSSRYGGAINLLYGGLTLKQCSFAENKSSSGGAIYNRACSLNTVNSSFIANNSTTSNGGAIYDFADGHMYPNYHNCLFYANSANSGGYGGAMFLDATGYWSEVTSHPTITNCTFTCNFAQNSGGGIYGDYTHVINIKNSIFWGNTDTGGTLMDESAQISGGSGVTISANYSCIQGLTGAFGGASNIDDDPLFIDTVGPDWLEGTGDEDLRIAASSPCIDAADNTVVPADSLDIDNDGNTSEPLPWDLAGVMRFIDDPAVSDTGNGTHPLVDMGSYEYDLTGHGACGDRNHPYPTYDFNKDCRVNLQDFMSFASEWLLCTAPGC